MLCSAPCGKNYNYSNNYEIFFLLYQTISVYADHAMDSAWPIKKSLMHGRFVHVGKTLTDLQILG